MTKRVIPQNLEAEQSLLGAIFLDPTILPQIADKVTIEDFYETKHQSIYRALLQLLEKNEKVDYTTVSKELATFQMMSKVGEVFVRTNRFYTNIAHVDTYVDYILDASLKGWLLFQWVIFMLKVLI